MSRNLIHGTSLATQIETSATSNLLGQLNALPQIGLFGLAIATVGRRWPALLVLLSVSEIGWAVVGGSKTAVAQVVIPLLLMYFHRHRIKPRPRAVFAGSILAVTLVGAFPYIDFYRSSVQQSVAERGSFTADALAKGAVAALSSQRPATNEDGGSVLDRINLAYYYGQLLESPYAEYGDRWNGSSYLPIVSWWVPRAAWPEKPVVSVGSWYGQKILGWSRWARSEGAITLWGDAYMNFGLWGVIAASLLWMFLTISLYNHSIRGSPWALLALGCVYMKMVFGLEQNAAAPIVAAQQTVLILVSLWLAATALEFAVCHSSSKERSIGFARHNNI